MNISYYNQNFLLFVFTESVLLLLVVVFYFYAVIGMEVFRGKVYVGCW